MVLAVRCRPVAHPLQATVRAVQAAAQPDLMHPDAYKSTSGITQSPSVRKIRLDG